MILHLHNSTCWANVPFELQGLSSFRPASMLRVFSGRSHVQFVLPCFNRTVQCHAVYPAIPNQTNCSVAPRPGATNFGNGMWPFRLHQKGRSCTRNGCCQRNCFGIAQWHFWNMDLGNGWPKQLWKVIKFGSPSNPLRLQRSCNQTSVVWKEAILVASATFLRGISSGLSFRPSNPKAANVKLLPTQHVVTTNFKVLGCGLKLLSART